MLVVGARIACQEIDSASESRTEQPHTISGTRQYGLIDCEVRALGITGVSIGSNDLTAARAGR
jgi:hypothetical protein